ncbi:MAG TPA: hypothetical protein VGL61_05825 [Kofleriaceae bacterium]|jgi:hypothetical protein
MRALGFVFLVACSFDPSSAQSTGTDAAPASGSAAMAMDAGGVMTPDAGLPGPPIGSGSDCDVDGMGPIGFGGGGHHCCGAHCGPH